MPANNSIKVLETLPGGKISSYADKTQQDMDKQSRGVKSPDQLPGF